LAFATLERFLISEGKKIGCKVLHFFFFARLKTLGSGGGLIQISFEGETGVKILSHKI